MLKLLCDIVSEVAKASKQQMKRAYMEWEKGNVIVFGRYINGKKL